MRIRWYLDLEQIEVHQDHHNLQPWRKVKSLPFKQINAKHELLACSVKLWWSIHPTHRGRPYFPTPFYCFNFGDNIEIFVWCHRQHICHSMKKLWIWWICQSHASCDCHLVIHQASAAAAWARARLLAPWNCLNASCPTPFSSSVQKQHPLESALSKILEPPTRAIQVQVVRLECYNFSHQYIRVDVMATSKNPTITLTVSNTQASSSFASIHYILRTDVDGTTIA